MKFRTISLYSDMTQDVHQTYFIDLKSKIWWETTNMLPWELKTKMAAWMSGNGLSLHCEHRTYRHVLGGRFYSQIPVYQNSLYPLTVTPASIWICLLWLTTDFPFMSHINRQQQKNSSSVCLDDGFWESWAQTAGWPEFWGDCWNLKGHRTLECRCERSLPHPGLTNTLLRFRDYLNLE